MFIPWWHSLVKNAESIGSSSMERKRRNSLSTRLQLEELEERLVLANPFYVIEQTPIPTGNVGTVVNVVIDIDNVPLQSSGSATNGLAGGKVVLNLPTGQLQMTAANQTNVQFG